MGLRRRHRVRRVVMWAAGVVLGLSVVGMVLGSLPDHLLRVASGCLIIRRALVTSEEGGVTLTQGAVTPPPDWWWPPKGMLSTQRLSGATAWVFVLPLWMPTAGAVFVLGGAWLLGNRTRARARSGHCPTCGYDLTGIVGVCPECGEKP